jgi:hypothetical protein
MKNDFRCPQGARIPENFRTFPEYPIFRITMERIDRWAKDHCIESGFMSEFHRGEETRMHCLFVHSFLWIFEINIVVHSTFLKQHNVISSKSEWCPKFSVVSQDMNTPYLPCIGHRLRCFNGWYQLISDNFLVFHRQLTRSVAEKLYWPVYLDGFGVWHHRPCHLPSCFRGASPTPSLPPPPSASGPNTQIRFLSSLPRIPASSHAQKRWELDEFGMWHHRTCCMSFCSSGVSPFFLSSTFGLRPNT